MNSHIRSLSDGERAILQQDGDESPEGPKILACGTAVARKRYVCDTCNAGLIEPGETYRRLVTLDEGAFKIERFCLAATPPSQPGNWACESERLQSEDLQRDQYVSYLTQDGVMSEAQANASYDELLAGKAQEKAEREAAEAARRKACPPRTDDPEDLPF